MVAIPDSGRSVRIRGIERQPERTAAEIADRNYKLFAAAMVLAGLFAAALYGALAAEEGARLRASTASALSALAAFAVGGLLGFLFAIPKSTPVGQHTNATTNNVRSWQANGNLEQISDWLTKILLGIGLTQLTSLPEQLQAAGEHVAASIGPAASPVVGATILVMFTIGGFVIGFLITRFDLGKAIDRQDGVISALATAVLQSPNDRGAVERLVLAALYERPPSGFEHAIQACEAYLHRPERGPASRDDAPFYGYLACAYAQKFKYERDETSASPENLASTRREALAHLTRAIDLDVSLRAHYRTLAMPCVGSTEDDLAVFKTDAEFQRVLQIPAADERSRSTAQTPSHDATV